MSMAAAIFDFGGVLTNNQLEVMRGFCGREGLAANALVDLFTANPAGRALFADLERGAITQPAWEKDIAAMLGVDADNLLRRILADLAPEPKVLDLVARLRADGVAVACLTNSFGLEPYDPYEPWHLAERFDLVVVSEVERARKPEPVMYERTLDRLGLPGAACVYVDDIAANLPPAAALGMATVLATSPDQVVADVEALLDR